MLVDLNFVIRPTHLPTQLRRLYIIFGAVNTRISEFIHVWLTGNHLHMQADQPYTDSIRALVALCIAADASALFFHLLFGTLTFSSHLEDIFPVAYA